MAEGEGVALDTTACMNKLSIPGVTEREERKGREARKEAERKAYNEGKGRGRGRREAEERM